MPNDRIHEVLTKFRNIAVVGLSSKTERPSHGVSAYMQQQGYASFPSIRMNPRCSASRPTLPCSMFPNRLRS